MLQKECLLCRHAHTSTHTHTSMRTYLRPRTCSLGPLYRSSLPEIHDSGPHDLKPWYPWIQPSPTMTLFKMSTSSSQASCIFPFGFFFPSVVLSGDSIQASLHLPCLIPCCSMLSWPGQRIPAPSRLKVLILAQRHSLCFQIHTDNAAMMWKKRERHGQVLRHPGLLLSSSGPPNTWHHQLAGEAQVLHFSKCVIGKEVFSSHESG